MTLESQLAALKLHLMEVSDLRAAAALLGWDQATLMPVGGANARGRQLATLNKLTHELFTDVKVGRWLDALAPLEASLPFDSVDASLIRVTRRDYERSTRVPSAFMREFFEHTAQAYQLWTQARPANDFALVADALQKNIDLSLQYASFFDGYAHPVDALIDESDAGMTVATIEPLFRDLRNALVPLVTSVTQQPEIDDSMLKQTFDEQKQLEFGLRLAERFGFDLSRGRQDISLHPFAESFSVNDVRITTRVKPDDLTEALFSTLHEAGHAMYEQGIHPELEGLPLASGTSSGVHESQSRLWENLVGRSEGFWVYAFPLLQQVFPEQFQHVSVEAFYAAINKVSRSLIRTDADELTYNLHIIIRFDFELALLNGSLSVRDLPEAWRARYQQDMGVASQGDTNGVLQDVHWFAGLVGGAFQGYALGNILSAQFYEAAINAQPDIPAHIQQGEFGLLHGWLRDNIYQYGRKFTATELIERASGQALSITPYIRYLNDKYTRLYGL